MSRQKQHQICTSRCRERFQAFSHRPGFKDEFMAGRDIGGSFEVDSETILDRPSSKGVEA